MRRLIISCILVAAAPYAFGQSGADETEPPTCDWTGTWSSSYGDIRIIQSDNAVTGDLFGDGRLTGSVDGACALNGNIEGGAAAVNGARVSFQLTGERFNGFAHLEGGSSQLNWGGTRRSTEQPTLRSEIAAQQTCDWTGTWSSSYGDLRLIQDGQSVIGDYANKGTIEGTLGADCALEGSFDNVRRETSGTIAFTLDGDRFNGIWGYDGGAQSNKWGGTRRSSDTPALSNQDMAETACIWTGTWSSSIGDLMLVQSGNQVTGQHRTAGEVSGTADECSLRGSIKNPADEKDRDFAILKSGRRFDGTWSWQDNSIFVSNVWGGTLRSAAPPRITPPSTPAPQDADPEPQEAEPVTEPDPIEEGSEKNMIKTWRVTLHSACVRNAQNDEDAYGVKLFGIAWVKARVTHKTTGEVITVAPLGGFPNLNSDQERVFEQTKDSAGLEAYVFDSRCAFFTQSGFDRNDNYTENETPGEPISVDFEIDAARFGYDDIEDLLSNRENRLRVMTKLSGNKRLALDPDFGTQARSTPLADANFCGSCKLSKDTHHPDGTFAYSMPGAPIGNGVLSGYKDGADMAAVFYDIKPLE